MEKLILYSDWGYLDTSFPCYLHPEKTPWLFHRSNALRRARTERRPSKSIVSELPTSLPLYGFINQEILTSEELWDQLPNGLQAHLSISSLLREALIYLPFYSFLLIFQFNEKGNISVSELLIFFCTTASDQYSDARRQVLPLGAKVNSHSILREDWASRGKIKCLC